MKGTVFDMLGADTGLGGSLILTFVRDDLTGDAKLFIVDSPNTPIPDDVVSYCYSLSTPFPPNVQQLVDSLRLLNSRVEGGALYGPKLHLQHLADGGDYRLMRNVALPFATEYVDEAVTADDFPLHLYL